MKYDPEVCERLVREAREDRPDVKEWAGWVDDNLAAMTDQLEAARREVERLTGCMSVAGLQCFIRGGAPEQVAEHMRRVVSSWMENEAKLTTERDAMRPVVEAACALYDCWCDPKTNDCSSKDLDDAIDAYRAAKGKAGGS